MREAVRFGTETLFWTQHLRKSRKGPVLQDDAHRHKKPSTKTTALEAIIIS